MDHAVLFRRVSISAALALTLPAAAPRAHAGAVDVRDRQAVIAFYETAYLGTGGSGSGWSGDVEACDAGDISAACRSAALARIAYFREMAGLPGSLRLNQDWNAECQEAALMMSANDMLSHWPTAAWSCYTAAGDEAAGKSNLALGQSSLASAITAWMDDDGQPPVGHRRWLLYPPLAETGLGGVAGSPNAFAMRVVGGSGSRPPTPDGVAWPPAGYVPYPIVPDLWSFSYPDADFSGATVTMTRKGVPHAVTRHPVQNGYGDNTLVWTPAASPMAAPPPGTDTAFTVVIDGVVIGGATRRFEYTVTVLDPLQIVPVAGTSWGSLKTRYR